MSIDYDNGEERMTMECDQCGKEGSFEGTWGDCIKEAKESGWYIRKEDEWKHFCQKDCYVEHLSNNRTSSQE